MATNLAGSGTATKGLNAPRDWWQALGREACAHGESIGAMVRRLVMAGAARENPALATRLRREAFRYYGSAALLALFLTILVVDHDVQARARRTRRSRQDDVGLVYCFFLCRHR